MEKFDYYWHDLHESCEDPFYVVYDGVVEGFEIFGAEYNPYKTGQPEKPKHFDNIERRCRGVHKEKYDIGDDHAGVDQIPPLIKVNLRPMSDNSEYKFNQKKPNEENQQTLIVWHCVCKTIKS